MLRQANCDYCQSSYVAHRKDQRFCCASHNVMYYQNKRKVNNQTLIHSLVAQQKTFDELKEENGALQKENDILKTEVDRLKIERVDRDEYLKGIIDRYKGIADKREEEIDRLENTIIKQKGEIDRLKLERRVYDQEKTKRHQHFTRDHLERVLTSEIKRQFPNDVIVQEHIGAIRSFNASYINALVTA